MVKHILADGREVDSIEGFIVPTTGATAAVYHLIAEFAKKHPENIQKKEKKSNATA